MTLPIWLKPGLMGAVVGAIALAVVGFSWGGWVTSSSAAEMADEQAEDTLVAALVPFCVLNSARDSNFSATIAEMKAARQYQRSDFVAKAGWATMPGQTEPNLPVARACVAEFASQM